MVVPTTARSVFVPVVSALLRSTESAPRTTQNPCSTGNTWVTATASASPMPVRSALRTVTDRPPRKLDVVDVTAVVAGISRSVAVVGGSRQSQRPCPHRPCVGGGRCGDHPAGRPDGGCDRPAVEQCAADRDGGSSSGAARIRSTSCR